MINMKNYTNTKGNVDFTAYRKAQKDSGEKCRQCGAYMLLNIQGVPRLCGSCKILSTNLQKEQAHDHRIRCPKCHETFDAHDYANEFEEYNIYQEHDEFKICCVFCEYIFLISVSVVYTFHSPAIINDTPAAGD